MVTAAWKLRTACADCTAPALRFMRMALLTLPALLACLLSTGSRAETVLADAAGREVHLAAPARRIVVNDSLLLLSLALIDPDPVGKIAGWAAPQRMDKGVFASFRQRFPQIDDIPTVGAVVPANASAESILSARPDLFVVSLWQPGWETVTDLLEAAGVPVIFLDGPENDGRDPAEATAFSIELLGMAIGQQAKAADYANFVRARYRSVTDRLRNVEIRPNVLIDAFAGTECCSIPGRDNRLKQNLELAGGRSIGSESVPGYEGRISAEYVLGADPDVYIGTGGPHLSTQGGLVLGGGFDAAVARASLEGILSQGIRRELTAVRHGRAFGVSHQLAISALSVLAFECFAKWTHPELFSELDPEETLAEINRHFLAVPLQGTFWIGLRDEADTTRP